MPQQATMGPAPMEGIERTNAVVVRGSGAGGGHVKIADGGLYFIFPFHFYFTLLYFFLLIFYF